MHSYPLPLQILCVSAPSRGVFIKKTSRKPDGVAMFWKTDKLQMKSYEAISLDKPNGDESGKATRPAVSPHVIGMAERGSVGVVAHFQHLETSLEFVVTTTHLFWDPAQEDVKLLQARRMLRAVDAFTSAMNASTPTIFAGDFNSLPDSKVYQFITDNKHFRSAYARYGDGGEPAFTNVNGATETEDKKQVPSFVGTLDYIFYRSTRYARLCSGYFPGLLASH
ncbi:hypothetical protein BBJ28_00007017 [Nothophytophthora sp. Chile5]|nr:hypothetical protein BBJ28_00007017 [Nothophytophthora sp. Chile5]